MAVLGCDKETEPRVRPRPLGHFRTLRVTAEAAPVWNGQNQVARVERGRVFGVIAEREGQVKIQVCDGSRPRRGWIAAEHVQFLTDADVDLVDEALKVSQSIDPEFDIAAYRARLDALATRLARAAAAGTTPREKVRLANVQLFEREGFQAGDVGVNLVDIVLDKRQGNCIGLSVLYLCATRKLGLPLYLVSAPQHVFVRYDDGRERFNIETTTGGTLHDDDAFLQEQLGRTVTAQAGGVDFLTLSNATVLGVLLQERAVLRMEMGQPQQACADLARSAEICPLDARPYTLWATGLSQIGETAAATRLCELALHINPRSCPARSLLGGLLSSQGRFPEACEQFAEAARLSPEDEMLVTVYAGWGLALALSGDYQAARVKFAVAADAAPEKRASFMAMRRALGRLHREGRPPRDLVDVVDTEARELIAHLPSRRDELDRDAKAPDRRLTEPLPEAP